LNNLALIFNQNDISINFSLFCCISDKFLQLARSISNFKFTLPEESVDIFISFLQILIGISFYPEDFEFSSLYYLIDFFGLNSLFLFITNNVQIPNTLSEALAYLNHPYSKFIDQPFQASLSILIENIELISVDQLTKLSNLQLEYIFSSSSLKIPNENFVFNLICQLIERNQNRTFLLKTIEFPFVSLNLLTEFFKYFHFDHCDFEVFEKLKKRLICEIFEPPLIREGRYKEKPKFFLKKEIEEMTEILKNHFGQYGNIIFQTQQLIL
jgi:hypothetical protein